MSLDGVRGTGGCLGVPLAFGEEEGLAEGLADSAARRCVASSLTGKDRGGGLGDMDTEVTLAECAPQFLTLCNMGKE